MELIGNYRGFKAYEIKSWDEINSDINSIYFGPEGSIVYCDRVVGEYRKSGTHFSVISFDIESAKKLKKSVKVELSSGIEEEKVEESELDKILREALTGMVVGGIDLREIK